MRVGAPDESTDPSKPALARGGTDPDFHVRPAIEGDDPLAQGGWHSSGGTKATVVALDAPPSAVDAPNTLLEAPPQPRRGFRVSSAEILVGTAGIAPGRVLVLVLIASALAFVLGRWTS